jgi:histidinol-phosphate aminotransferase
MKCQRAEAIEEIARKREMVMTRRDYLTASGLALGGLVISAAAGETQSAMQPRRVRLSLNENPFGPSPLAIAAVQSEFGNLSRYVDKQADVLTPVIVAHEQVSADQIVLGEVLEALGLHLAKQDPGGEFIYSDPGYTALVDAAARAGGVAVGVPLDQNLENDLAAIAAKVNAQTRAIYLINPHNPSGTVSDATKFATFVSELSERAVVIVDEAYLEFEPDFTERTVVGLTRTGKNVVVFRTFDKIYGLAGLSMGYAVVPKSLAAALKRGGIGSPEPFGRLALAAAAGSLRDKEYVASVRSKVIAERDLWHRVFDTLRLRHSDARGNFVFFQTGRPHQEIAGALLAKGGIDIGRGFPPLDHWARISIGLPEENALARTAVSELMS